jgi:SAM-dependent methyltransferase
MCDQDAVEFDWRPFTERYRRGEWRAPIFADMVLTDMARLGSPRSLTLLDIGCGTGFDDDLGLQIRIAENARKVIGIEPDGEVVAPPILDEFHNDRFENAPIESCSIDVAFAVMVLEHVDSPARFWSKLYDVLKDGGVFWGFTVDARNWFAKASSLIEGAGIKDWYLNRLLGAGGVERYANYPVYYRCNTPAQIEAWTATFRSRTIRNFHRVGQLDYYIPKPLRWIGRRVDWHILSRGLPGTLMAIRLVK